MALEHYRTLAAFTDHALVLYHQFNARAHIIGRRDDGTQRDAIGTDELLPYLSDLLQQELTSINLINPINYDTIHARLREEELSTHISTAEYLASPRRQKTLFDINGERDFAYASLKGVLSLVLPEQQQKQQERLTTDLTAACHHYMASLRGNSRLTQLKRQAAMDMLNALTDPTPATQQEQQTARGLLIRFTRFHTQFNKHHATLNTRQHPWCSTFCAFIVRCLSCLFPRPHLEVQQSPEGRGAAFFQPYITKITEHVTPGTQAAEAGHIELVSPRLRPPALSL